MKKMRYSRRLLAATAVIIGLGAGSIGIGTTLAASPMHGGMGDPISGLVEVIAERFNLSETDVQAVFDEQREKLHQEHVAREAEMLAKAVTAGKLTRAQADAIIARNADNKEFMESLVNLDEAARKAAMQTHVAETKAWAEENDIPEPFIFMNKENHGGRHGGHAGREPGRGFYGERPIAPVEKVQ